MSDPLTEMRELWKHFGLGKDKTAAMRITYDNGEVKSHGEMPDVSQMRAFDAIPSPGFSPDMAGRDSRGNRAGRGGKRG